MAQSPAKDIPDPLIGSAGGDETGKPKQHTDAEQRSEVSGAKGTEAPGSEGGVSAAAVKGAQDAADKLGEAGGSRKDIETGSKAQ